MTSPTARATVVVTLDTSGVREELRRAIRAASQGLTATVKADVDGSSLRAARQKIARDTRVTAEVTADVDEAKLFVAKLRVKQALGSVVLPVSPNVDSALYVAKIRIKQAMDEAEQAARAAEREARQLAKDAEREAAQVARDLARQAAATGKTAGDAFGENFRKSVENESRKARKAIDLNIGSGTFRVQSPFIAPLIGGAAALGGAALVPSLGAIAAAAPVLTGLVPIIATVTSLIKEDATVVKDLSDNWAAFKSQVTPSVLPDIAAWSDAASAGLRQLQPVTVAVAQELAVVGHQWSTALSGPGFTKIFSDLTEQAHSGAIESINNSIINLTRGVGSLITAFNPLVVDFSSGLDQIATKFANWAAGLSTSAGFARFLTFIETQGHTAIEIIKNIGGTIGNLLPTLASIGAIGLTALNDVAKAVKFLTGLPFAPFVASVVLGTFALRELFTVLKLVTLFTKLQAGLQAATLSLKLATVGFVAMAGSEGVAAAGAALLTVALRGLVVTLGPVAIAVTALVAAYELFGNKSKQAIDNSVIPGSARDRAQQLGIATAGLTDAQIQLAIQGREAGISINGMSAAAVAAAAKLATAQKATNQASIDLGQYAVAAKAATDANTIALDRIKKASSDAVNAFQDALSQRSLTEGLASAQQDLANAVANVAKSAQESRRQIRDSIQSVNEARQREKDVAIQNAQQIADAERSLVEAQKSSAQAQRDLTQARADAAQTIRDLIESADDAQRSQESADIALQRARAAYQLTLGNESLSDLDRREALLRLRDAEDAASDATREAEKAIKDRNTAQKNGVDKAPSVLAAQQNLINAQQAEKRAVQDVAKAHQDAARSSIDAALQTQRAQESLTAAYQTASENRVSSENAVRAAHLRVRDAVDAIRLKMLELKDKTIQAIVVPTIAGTFDSKGNFIPSSTTTSGKTSITKNGKTIGFQRGTLLPGYGGGDIQPAMLEPGEAVVPKHLVHEMAPWARARGIPGFASGGVVGNVQNFIRAQDPKPYVWGAVGPGAYDCSGLTGDVWAALTGHPMFHRYFTTSSNLSSFGFQPGTGEFTIGVNPGQHMVGNLGGLAFEAQSSQTGIKVGSDATSVLRMAQQWFLPQLGGRFAASGGAPPSGFDRIEVNARDLAPVVNRAALNTAGSVAASVVNAVGGNVRVPDHGAYTVPGSLIPTLAAIQRGLPENISGATPPRSTSRAANMALARQLVGQFGWSRYWPSYNSLEMGEAGYDNLAQNPSSTAFGIGQFLDSTWATVGGVKTSDPAKQIMYMLKYISKSYGNPDVAYSRWLSRSPHWYDNGGVLEPGLTLAMNGTGRPETIRTASQEAALSGRQPVVVNFAPGSIQAGGQLNERRLAELIGDAVAAKLEERDRQAMKGQRR